MVQASSFPAVAWQSSPSKFIRVNGLRSALGKIRGYPKDAYLLFQTNRGSLPEVESLLR